MVIMDLLGPNLDVAAKVMLDLGKRHIRYGAKPAMFVALGNCLLETLQDALGDEDMTEQTKQAWKDVYNFVMFHMNCAQIRQPSEKFFVV
jgi:hemoglobin-like flavoprotein